MYIFISQYIFLFQDIYFFQDIFFSEYLYFFQNFFFHYIFIADAGTYHNYIILFYIIRCLLKLLFYFKIIKSNFRSIFE